MAINIAPLNAPYDVVQMGEGRIMAFCIIFFDTTAVGGITGTTYDPTNHLTTSFRNGIVPGQAPFDYWGMSKEIDAIEFCGGSSDQQAKSANANSACGHVKARFDAAGQYIELKIVGAGGLDGTGDVEPNTTQDEAELDATAGTMDALVFTAKIIGRASRANPAGSGLKFT